MQIILSALSCTFAMSPNEHDPEFFITYFHDDTPLLSDRIR